VRTYLGIDGGGSKTRFLLIDDGGRTLATHTEGPAYYLETGLDELKQMLARGIRATLARGSIAAADLGFAFLGLPAYGEDSRVRAALDSIGSPVLPAGRYRCGNDMVCAWAGALAGADGINIVAGTGSIAYGEYAGRDARAGGWGELFSDEGSAYWLAREGLRLFSRMSDGRTARGALHEIVRRHFGVHDDLDVCGAIYGTSIAQRSQFALLAQLVTQAASVGDTEALSLFASAGRELAAIVDAVHGQLQVPAGTIVPLSYSGGMFQGGELLLTPFKSMLGGSGRRYRLVAPRLPPEVGAALYAAKLAGTALDSQSIAALESILAS
jgi:N-acetylglucosamine kinase-like BadF-type ATPase